MFSLAFVPTAVPGAQTAPEAAGDVTDRTQDLDLDDDDRFETSVSSAVPPKLRFMDSLVFDHADDVRRHMRTSTKAAVKRSNSAYLNRKLERAQMSATTDFLQQYKVSFTPRTISFCTSHLLGSTKRVLHTL